MSAVTLKPDFEQVCIWPACIVSADKIAEFEAFFVSDFNGVRIQYLEEILTNPDRDSDGDPVMNTGGRNDVFFAVHKDDIAKFAVPRLQMGIRWVEDALASHNHSAHLYPSYVREYLTWDADLDDPEGDGQPDEAQEWHDFDPDC